MTVIATPFGKYADLLATIVGLLTIVAAITVHLFNLQVLQSGDTTFIDEMAWLFVGLIGGTRSAANGYAKTALAAHARLDALGAPPTPPTS